MLPKAKESVWSFQWETMISGGIYISTPADYIFAEPTTRKRFYRRCNCHTSTFENAMDYIGVNFDGVVTSKYGGWGPTKAIN